jgi:membrane-bound lytic murein transglycosylase A
MESAMAKSGKSGWSTISYEPVKFADVPGWADDDHRKAYSAFLKSCERLKEIVRHPEKGSGFNPNAALMSLCVTAEMLPAGSSNSEARAFFERYFVPHRVLHAEPDGLFTGYYEPVIEGSRTPDNRFKAAVYRRPPDLVNLVDESERGAKGNKLTHARQSGGKIVAYPTREEIDKGALKGKGLELVYLEDPVDVFFMQIQGSGKIRLTDGSTIRIGYDGKNGHPYTSLGGELIKKGIIPADKMSLEALAKWMKSNQERARKAMWANKSYVFFREHGKDDGGGTHGVHKIPLTAGRSLAVDTKYHAIGLPVFVCVPTLKFERKPSFNRLLVAQDVGSAIKGPERGDIFFGSGQGAARMAGTTKHPGNMFVLRPREEEGAPRRQADARAAQRR